MTYSKSVVVDGKPAEDQLVVELITQALDLIRRNVEAIVEDRPRGQIEIPVQVPFSRAEAADYYRLVELWNRSGTPELSTLPVRTCPACAAPDSNFLFRSYDGYPYHGCRTCGSWFVPLAVNESLIESFFGRVPAAKSIADRMMQGREVKTKAADRERFFTYFDLASPIINAKLGVVRYLDIGCGVGHSVELGKELGFDAVGLEVSRMALATARSHGRCVYHPEEWKPTHEFDFISLFETLEHVTDPDALIRKLEDRLAPGGALIVTVPNVLCWEVQLLKGQCFHVFGGTEQVGHINLFTPDGIRRLLARNNLSTVFLDGQFGSNLQEIAASLLMQRSSVTAAFEKGVLASKLPRDVHTILNALGPDLAVLDRALLRSPILIAVACRKEDADRLQPLVEQMHQGRRRELLAALSKPMVVPAPRQTAPVPSPVAAPAALFGNTASIPGFLSPDTERVLGAKGFTSSVFSGLSLRSSEPLRFERMAKLGGGRLAAGRYELAAHAKLRRGLVTFALFDEARQAWVVNEPLVADATVIRAAFTLSADADVTLYVCANNSDAARPTDIDVFDAGIAALSAAARLIVPPPPPDRSVVPQAPLFGDRTAIPGFLSPDTERVLGAKGFTSSVFSGLSLRSSEPLRFERMAKLGGGRLAAGRYELAAHAKLRRGLVTFALFDEARQAWVVNEPLVADATVIRAAFTLSADADVTLYVCANNSDAARPTDIDVFDAGIAALSAAARLIVPPPPPDRSVVPQAPLFGDRTAIPGFLSPDTERVLGAKGFTSSVFSGLSLRSSEPLRFERMAKLGGGRLAAGRYELAAHAKLRRGLVTFALFDEARQAWVVNEPLVADATVIRAAFTLSADADVTLYVCANNSDAARPTDIDVFDAGIAALSAAARLIVPPPPPDRSVVPQAPLFGDRTAIPGFLSPDTERVLGAKGFTSSVFSGLSLRSSEPLRFERMAKLGGGRLAAGRYELAAHAKLRRGLVTFALFDEARQAWVVNEPLVADATVIRAAFTLSADADVTLYVCANNSDTARPTDIDVFDAGIAALSDTARLIVPAEVPRTRSIANLFDAAPEAKPLHGILLPVYDALAASRENDGVATAISFRSEQPLRFEYLARFGRCTLGRGRYILAVTCLVRAGYSSISILDAKKGQWIAAIPLVPAQEAGHVLFELPDDTSCILYLCANNSEKAAPVHIDVHAVGIAALDGGGVLPEKGLRETPDKRGRKLLANFLELSANRLAAGAVAGELLPDEKGRSSSARRSTSLRIVRDLAAREYLHKGAELALPAGTYRLRIAGRVDAGALAVGILDEVRDAWIVNVGLAGGETWGEQEFVLDAPVSALLIVSGNNAVPGQITAEITAIDLDVIED